MLRRRSSPQLDRMERSNSEETMAILRSDYDSSQQQQVIMTTTSAPATGCNSLLFGYGDDDVDEGEFELIPFTSSSDFTSNSDEDDDDNGDCLLPDKKADTATVCDNQIAESYMAKREMTVTQERWNALTVLPNPIYCLYFILAGLWVPQQMENQDESSLLVAFSSPGTPEQQPEAPDMEADLSCLPETWWHNMPSLPPLPVVAVAFGICLHAPFSILYHWTYATKLSTPKARSLHWSRRMDQCMIHICSAFMSYGTSGNWNYFGANVLYNLDCCRLQFQNRVHPKRNQYRILIAMLAYTLPILKRGQFAAFLQVWTVLLVSVFFFAAYPIGGWSHSVFHLLICGLPPLLMHAASQLVVSEDAMWHAVQCSSSTMMTTATSDVAS